MLLKTVLTCLLREGVIQTGFAITDNEIKECRCKKTANISITMHLSQYHTKIVSNKNAC